MGPRKKISLFYIGIGAYLTEEGAEFRFEILSLEKLLWGRAENPTASPLSRTLWSLWGAADTGTTSS